MVEQRVVERWRQRRRWHGENDVGGRGAVVDHARVPRAAGSRCEVGLDPKRMDGQAGQDEDIGSFWPETPFI
jgi:hypothetical protein